MEAWIGLFVAGAITSVIAVLTLWHIRHAPTRAVVTPEGYQEATITVKKGYRPHRIVVEKGMPVRLHFIRDEDDPCSERVIFADVGVDRRLPAFRDTTIEFTPLTSGTFLFTCQMGMYRGKLLVT